MSFTINTSYKIKSGGVNIPSGSYCEYGAPDLGALDKLIVMFRFSFWPSETKKNSGFNPMIPITEIKNPEGVLINIEDITIMRHDCTPEEAARFMTDGENVSNEIAKKLLESVFGEGNVVLNT